MADLPVIMATAKDASDDVVKALELGANDYVTKPLDFPVLLARVRTQLALRHATRALALFRPGPIRSWIKVKRCTWAPGLCK